MAITDSIVRLLKGAISDDSTKEESFDNSLLEYPQYTYPIEYEGKKIPDILFCGNHKAVDEYRRKEAIKITMERRKDLLDQFTYSKKDYELIRQIKEEKQSEEAQKAIEKGKKFIPNNK